MGISSISSIGSNMSYAVSAVNMGGSHLSEELIKKLKELGIDPSKVKSPAEAQTLIAQAEKNGKAQGENAQVQPKSDSQVSSYSTVNVKELNDDINALGDKLGIDVKSIEDKKELVNVLDAGVKEFVQGASAQSNMADMTVKMKNGAEAKGKPQEMEVELNSVKDRIEKLDVDLENKKKLFAGQDMLAAMNRMALGI